MLLAFSLVREPADSGVDGKSLGYCHNGGAFHMIVRSTEEGETQDGQVLFMLPLRADGRR
jgi:hypothetical protein